VLVRFRGAEGEALHVPTGESVGCPARTLVGCRFYVEGSPRPLIGDTANPLQFLLCGLDAGMLEHGPNEFILLVAGAPDAPSAGPVRLFALAGGYQLGEFTFDVPSIEHGLEVFEARLRPEGDGWGGVRLRLVGRSSVLERSLATDRALCRLVFRRSDGTGLTNDVPFRFLEGEGPVTISDLPAGRAEFKVQLGAYGFRLPETGTANYEVEILPDPRSDRRPGARRQRSLSRPVGPETDGRRALSAGGPRAAGRGGVWPRQKRGEGAQGVRLHRAGGARGADRPPAPGSLCSDDHPSEPRGTRTRCGMVAGRCGPGRDRNAGTLGRASLVGASALLRITAAARGAGRCRFGRARRASSTRAAPRPSPRPCAAPRRTPGRVGMPRMSIDCSRSGIRHRAPWKQH